MQPLKQFIFDLKASALHDLAPSTPEENTYGIISTTRKIQELSPSLATTTGI